MTDTTASPRDLLRSKIFSGNDKRTKIIEFFGAKIEIRQPSTGEILDAKEDENSQRGLISILVRYAYVPGTNQKVFEPADEENILALPFGPDMIRVNETVAALTEINVVGKNESSTATT